ncbi:MAG: acyltransferase family protein [Galactobacter sp.]
MSGPATSATGAGAPGVGGRRRGRDLSTDSLRGIAVVLMVAGHVVGTTATEGMRVADDSGWRMGYVLLSDLRLPLFTALSGFVYGARPLTGPPKLPGFLKGKARRLLVPLVTVGTAFALLQALIPGTNNTWDLTQLWQVYVYGLWHFWFLQAIFVLLLGVGIANAVGWLRSGRSIACTAAVAAVLTVSVRVPDPYAFFSINGVLRLAPYFLLGYGLRVVWSRGGHRPWVLLAAVVLFCLRSTEIVLHIAVPPRLSSVLGLALGMTGIASLILYRERLKVRALARLGYFSFGIYLLHVFGVAPTRMAVEAGGVSWEPAVFGLCLAVGIGLPVLFEVTLGRVKWVSWAVLGQKPYRGVPSA